jgi:hypothetical protein
MIQRHKMSRVFGANPRPRILLEAIPEELHQQFVDVFPTVATVEDRSEVDQVEFDVLVTTQSALGADKHLYVIVFGAESGGPMNIIDSTRSGTTLVYAQWIGSSKGREFHVPIDRPAILRRFIETRLIPILRSKRENLVIGQIFGSPSTLTPFVATARGEVLAGSFSRASGFECWALPIEAVPHAAECAAVAVELWRDQDQTRFPRPVEDWTVEARWQSVTEEAVRRDLAELRRARDHVLEKFRTDEQLLEAKLQEARALAETDDRVLLTTQGDELVRAVKRALEVFGFEVQYMDDVWPAGDRREDLRVSVAGDPAWTNITEVRGYVRGAELNDLLRIGRFRSRFARDEGSLPSSSWYIANEFIGQDPGTRPMVLQSNDQEVDTFGEDDGLILSSVTLFDMLMDWNRGALTSDEARRILRESRGRLSYERRT